MSIVTKCTTQFVLLPKQPLFELATNNTLQIRYFPPNNCKDTATLAQTLHKWPRKI